MAIEQRGIEAHGDGGHAARHLRVRAAPPEHREPALHAADDARDDARRAPEVQAGDHGRGVAHVHGGVVGVDAKLGAEDGDDAKDRAAEQLARPVAHVLEGALVKQLGEPPARDDGQQRGEGKLRNDEEGLHGVRP